MLIRIKAAFPNEDLIQWKSDISEAYRVAPMHPAWQVKQVVEFDGNYYVDRCNCFGSSASFAIFVSINALVTWIAKNKRDISCIVTYLDDSSGCTFAGNLSFYEPYQKFLPAPQVRLLTLWDDLGLPHKERKQLCASPLPVIGIEVNPNEPSFTMSKGAKDRLISELKLWCSSEGFRDTLRRWQQLAGWLNWAFNVFPLLRPCLNRFYPKICGKTTQGAPIWVNGLIREDFEWAIKLLNKSRGVLLLKSLDWPTNDATHTIFCDASSIGMGFWYPNLHIGLMADNPPNDGSIIFYFEALCVLGALRDVRCRSPKGSKVVIYTDNLNTVNIFSSLRCSPDFNVILRAAVNLIASGELDIRVLHVPGEKNCVADALSRKRLDVALSLDPQLRVSTFQPYRRHVVNKKVTFTPPSDGMLGEEEQ